MGNILNLQDCIALQDRMKHVYDVFQAHVVWEHRYSLYSPPAPPLAHGDLRQWWYQALGWAGTSKKGFYKKTLDMTLSGERKSWEEGVDPIFSNFNTNNLDTPLNIAGLPYGFSRHLDGGVLEYGLPEEGDILGDWHFDEIEACLDAMVYFPARVHCAVKNTENADYHTDYGPTEVDIEGTPIVYWNPPAVGSPNPLYQTERQTSINILSNDPDADFSYATSGEYGRFSVRGGINAYWEVYARYIDYNPNEWDAWICSGDAGFWAGNTSGYDVVISRNFVPQDVSYRSLSYCTISDLVLTPLQDDKEIFPVNISDSEALPAIAPDIPDEWLYYDYYDFDGWHTLTSYSGGQSESKYNFYNYRFIGEIK